MLQDQYRALMQYSIPKDCHVDKPPAKNTQDWHCVKVRLFKTIQHFPYLNATVPSICPLFAVRGTQFQEARNML